MGNKGIAALVIGIALACGVGLAGFVALVKVAVDRRADPGLGDVLDGGRREAAARRALGRAGAGGDRRQGEASDGGGVMDAIYICHSGMARRARPGIHIHQPWLWIPGSRLRRAPE